MSVNPDCDRGVIEPSPAGPGYVGPAGSLDDPNGDLTR